MFKVLLVYPNTMMATLTPLSIATLSAVLKKEGFEVELFDTTFYKTEEISFEKKKEELLQVKPFKEIAEYKGDLNECVKDFGKCVADYEPNLIAISLVEDTIGLGLRLLDSVREAVIPVVAGGVGVNFNQEILFDSDLIDYLCIGEGEKALVEVCNAFKNITDPTAIDNIAYQFLFNYDNEDDIEDIRIAINSIRNPVNINTLPYPDFDIFEEKRLYRVMHGKKFKMLHVEIDRGCPFSCSYCCAPALRRLQGNRYYRKKSNDRIIGEMLYLKQKYEPDYFNFSSETLLARTEKELIDLMVLYTRDIGIPFWCQSRPETITEEKVAILKTMGVADFQLGIEHGNAAFRREWLNRKDTNEQIINACQLLNKYEIPYTVNNLIGFAHEDRDLIFDTINLNKEINLPYLKNMNVYIVNPYRGTELFKRYLELGLIKEDAKSMQLLGGKELNRLYLTQEEILGFQRTFPLYVKMPYYNLNRIKRAEKFDDIGNNVYESLRRDYIKTFYK